MAEEEVKRILVVDDDRYVGQAVQRELNSPPFVRYRYAVEVFDTPAAALQRAREIAFDAVVSDYRMPVMDGLQFLKALAEIQPACVRLVLSGQTDMDGLARMVNETHIYRFVAKPWNAHFLKAAIAQALDYSAALVEYRCLADLVRANSLLVLPVPEREVDRILVVDDDLGVLHSLSRVLTQHSPADDVFAAVRTEAMPFGGVMLHEDLVEVQVTPSPQRALQLAASETFSCVLADFRMPEMSGIDLLQKFSELQPDCARILVSGQVDEADLVRAIDSAGIYAFIEKPWSDAALKAQVAMALARRRMLRENRRLAEMVR